MEMKNWECRNLGREIWWAEGFGEREGKFNERGVWKALRDETREGGKIMQNLIWSVWRFSQFDYSHTIRPIRVNSAWVPNGFSVSSSHVCVCGGGGGYAASPPQNVEHQLKKNTSCCGHGWWTGYKVLYTDHKSHIISTVVITDEEKQNKTNNKKNMKVMGV